MFFLLVAESPRVSSRPARWCASGTGAALRPRRGRDERGGRCWSRSRSPARAPTACRSTDRRCGASAICDGRCAPVFFGPRRSRASSAAIPSQRRGFMDEAFGSLWPLQGVGLTAYERALRQRNRLLKEWEGRGAPTGLEAWDAELVEAGCALIAARADGGGAARAARGAGVRAAPRRLRPGRASTAPRSGRPAEPHSRKRSRARLAERRSDELIRRTTLVGPHRDDLELAVRDLGARASPRTGRPGRRPCACASGSRAPWRTSSASRPSSCWTTLLGARPGPAARGRRAASADRARSWSSVADDAHVPANAVDAVCGDRGRRRSSARRGARPDAALSSGFAHGARTSATPEATAARRRRRRAAARADVRTRHRGRRSWRRTGPRSSGHGSPRKPPRSSLDGGVLVVVATTGPWGAQARFLAEEIRNRPTERSVEGASSRCAVVVRDDPGTACSARRSEHPRMQASGRAPNGVRWHLG